MQDLPQDSAETSRLLTRIRCGDPAAFDKLFERHREPLHDFLAHRIGPDLRGRLDASDVVQETQLEALRRMSDYLDRRPMPFRVWLRKTGYERLLMLRRRHHRGRRDAGREAAMPEASSLALAQRLACSASSPSRQAQRNEQARHVRQALTKLADEDREVLLMRNFEELPYGEIALLLDITPAAARQRHGRALMKLSRLLPDADSARPADE